MSLTDQEKKSLAERLDNMEQLAKKLEYYGSRENRGPDEKRLLSDAHRMVQQAIPSVKRCVEGPSLVYEPEAWEE